MDAVLKETDTVPTVLTDTVPTVLTDVVFQETDAVFQETDAVLKEMDAVPTVLTDAVFQQTDAVPIVLKETDAVPIVFRLAIPSVFQETDAVPAVLQDLQKRRLLDQSVSTAKRLRLESRDAVDVEDAEDAVDGVDAEDAEDAVDAVETPETDLVVLGDGVQEVFYFQTVPSVSPAGGRGFSPDTVLSSALSSAPITSTLPIVSKHAAPSLVLAAETPEDGGQSEDGEGDGGQSEDGGERDHQLEEHCYHRDSRQLDVLVVDLQRTVKVLQQRHRRHQDKLLDLESTVVQLRQTNLVHQETLTLLEKAYIQSSEADAGETVTLIYQDHEGHMIT